MNKLQNRIKKNFTTIPNELIINNDITDRARFLFCYMASRPENWCFWNNQLAQMMGYSVDTLRKYINELVNTGWLIKEAQTIVNGKFGNNNYYLNSYINEKIPIQKNTVSEKPRHGKIQVHSKPDSISNTDLINNKEEEKEISLPYKNKNIDTTNDKTLSVTAFNELEKGALPQNPEFATLLQNPEFNKTWVEWLEFRKQLKLKKYTEIGLNKTKNKLLRLSNNNPATAILLLDQSMENGWQGIWELKAEIKAIECSANFNDIEKKRIEDLIKGQDKSFKEKQMKLVENMSLRPSVIGFNKIIESFAINVVLTNKQNRTDSEIISHFINYFQKNARSYFDK